jgi:hypothetical protein
MKRLHPLDDGFLRKVKGILARQRTGKQSVGDEAQEAGMPRPAIETSHSEPPHCPKNNITTNHSVSYQVEKY